MRTPLLAVTLLLASGCATVPPSPRAGYAPVNGLRLYYEDHPGSAPQAVPLVLLHGGGSTIQTSFAKVLPALARSRRVIAFEQQGHGHTGDVDRPFDFRQSAKDTVALLRHLGIQRADLLGYSNGGHIALEVALRHPGFVRKLIVESAMFSKDGAEPGFWEGFNHAKLEEMPPELSEAYVKTSPHPEKLPTFFVKCVERMRMFKGWPPEEIHGIRAPTLVLVGDRDVARPEHAVQMFRLLPHGELAVLPGTDHMRMVKRADVLVPIVEGFLDAPMPRE